MSLVAFSIKRNNNKKIILVYMCGVFVSVWRNMLNKNKNKKT